MIPISSWKSRSPRVARYSIGSGPEDRGVDLGDRVHQAAQPLGFAALVRHEQALVLARERRADTVLEQARAAHDEWHVPKALERERQPVRQLGRERRVPEDLHDVRVLPPDLLDLEVLVVVDVVELVVLDEAQDAVGGDGTTCGECGSGPIAAALRCAPMIASASSRPELLPPSLPWLPAGAIVRCSTLR